MNRQAMSALSMAMVALLLSSLINFAAFARWPGNPDDDVHHSVFAAETFLATGQFKSINLYPDNTDDLAHHAQRRWMTHWPPVHSWLYGAVMSAGLSAGMATKLLGLMSVLVGGAGAVRLARRLEGTGPALLATGLAYPWLYFTAKVYFDYKNDHWACAILPWMLLGIIRIEPLRVAGKERWAGLLGAALLVGLSLLIKYSMLPFFVAAALYLIWLDGLDLSRGRLMRLGAAGATAAMPAAGFWLFNFFAVSTSYPLRPGGGLALAPVTAIKNLVANLIGAASGWSLMLTEFDGFLERRLGRGLPAGVLAAISASMLGVWSVFLARSRLSTPRLRCAVFLAIVTAVLPVMLAVMTIKSGAKYDYTGDVRFYFPVALGWIILCGVSLFPIQARKPLWLVAAASLAAPLAFSVAFSLLQGLTAQPLATMPMSRTAWPEGVSAVTNGPIVKTVQDPRYAGFLADLVKRRGHKPDLSVTTSGHFLTELAVPTLYSFVATVPTPHVYYSSRDLEVWAMVPPGDEQAMLSNFARAATREKIDTPPGFPYVVYIMAFKAEAPPPGAR